MIHRTIAIFTGPSSFGRHACGPVGLLLLLSVGALSNIKIATIARFILNSGWFSVGNGWPTGKTDCGITIIAVLNGGPLP